MIAAPNRPEPRERPDRWLPSPPSPDEVDRLVRQLFALGVEAAHGYRYAHDHTYSAVKGANYEGGSHVGKTSHSDPTESAVLLAQREAAAKARMELLGAFRQLGEARRQLEFARGAFESHKQPEWTKNATYFGRDEYEQSVAALARRRERGEI